MKVLFVGEGPHDIGHDTSTPGARPLPGVVQTLARRVCPQLAEDSPSMQWKDIPRFHPDRTRRGFGAKMKAAALRATHTLGCDGLVCVVDRDRDDRRAHDLRIAAESLATPIPVAWGVAVESIEAWTLGVPDAMAEVLAVDVRRVRALLPPKHIEALVESSGHAEHRPKEALTRIAALGHRESDREFRVDVAQRTDPSKLAEACPEGFAPFADRLRQAFPTNT